MEHKHFQEDLKETSFEILNQIQPQQLSGAFKSLVFDAIQDYEDQKNIPVFLRSTKLQFAAMLIVLLVNSSAIFYAISSDQQSESFETFTKEYNLSVDDADSIY